MKLDDLPLTDGDFPIVASCTPPELGACEQFDWSLALHPGWCVPYGNGYRSARVMADELRRPDFRWDDFRTLAPRWQACT